MFRHRNAIFRESKKTKDHKSNTSLEPQSPLIPKHTKSKSDTKNM